MCGIFGIATNRQLPSIDITKFFRANNARGRDSWGYYTHTMHGRRERSTHGWAGATVIVQDCTIANMRAEPTTEFVLDKKIADVQPYEVGEWAIVHNGTIANDKELIAKYNLTPPTRIDSWVIAALCDKIGFTEMLKEIVGSYAIIAIKRSMPNTLHFAMNYRPLYLHRLTPGVDVPMGIEDMFALSSVPLSMLDTLLPPYSSGVLTVDADGTTTFDLATRDQREFPRTKPDKALVVFSGGLDSTVAAAALQHEGFEVELLHFNYGARATGPEGAAVTNVAEALGVPLHIIQTSIFTDVIKGSRLTNTKDEAVAENEAGAEYAHEWVPARNLILTSIALGIAEARGFDVLALGANLEEAGAYPDNEPEFLRQFNKLIPFAVADGKHIRIETPVGNLMKHEIVKLGMKVGAPMHLSWSCYDANKDTDGRFYHCGKCGPCFMRKTAFAINGSEDPVFEVTEEITFESE